MFILGKGFNPNSQSNLDIKETGTPMKVIVSQDGSCQNYFKEDITIPTHSLTRTLTIDGDNYYQDVVFKIDKSIKNREIYIFFMPNSLTE